MNKVLITGIDSFTGKHLSSYLENSGYDVYGTSLSKNAEKKYKCDITNKKDILNILEVLKPDFFIHLSGISFAAHGNSEDFYKVNTIGTINILDAFIELNLNPEKIVIASSATVYGNQGIEILDESMCPHPANHYGASKYVMECMAKNYFNRLNIVITRPFNYTGIGQPDHFLIPKIVKHFKEKKQIIELGNINVSREFNSVDFVCEVYKRILENNISGEIINISTNKGVKLLDVISIMNKLAGYEIKIEINPFFVRKDEISKLTGSNVKLLEFLGQFEEKPLNYLLKEMFEV